MKDERPDAWQPTPRLRWIQQTPMCIGVTGPDGKAQITEIEGRLILQQLWHIPNSEQYDWRDVPTVREGDEVQWDVACAPTDETADGDTARIRIDGGEWKEFKFQCEL